MTWTYKGRGFLPGIPARDLSDAEASALGITNDLAESRLYEYHDDKPAKAAKPDPEPAPEAPADEEAS